MPTFKKSSNNFLSTELSGVLLQLLYLGFDIDVIQDMFHISEEELSMLQKMLNSILELFI